MTNEDLLYNYFSHSLTEEQTVEFNNRLESDAEFKAQFEFENNLKRAIHHEAKTEIKTKLKEFEATIKASETPRKAAKFYWRVAASIVLLIGASWFGYNTLFAVDYNDLYASNFETYPNTEFAITRSDTIDTVERKAFVSYEAGDYEAAITNFENIKTVDKKFYHDFYKAQAYLKTENIESAKTLLKSILSKNQAFSGESQWYLALIALKEKNKIEATTRLRNLIENFDYNTAKAENLLKALH